MKDNKPWYKKIGTWIGIIASICTILSFIFSISNKSSENVNKTNSNTNSNVNNIEGDGIIVTAPIEIGGDVIIGSNKPDATSTQTSEIEENVNQDVIDEVIEEQPYPDDYVIIWEDKTFERLMQECLNKEKITYADVKNILTIEIFDDKIILDKEGEDEKFDYNLIYRKTPNSISLNDLKYFDSLVLLSIFNFQSINCDIFDDEIFSNRLRGLYISVELDSNQIRQISKLNNLQSLFIERNNISTSDLETISSIEGLIELSLWDDNITDISALSNLKQLMYLDLSRNNITNIDALSELEILETVLLAGNNITDYSPVAHLGDKNVIKTAEEQIDYFNNRND